MENFLECKICHSDYIEIGQTEFGRIKTGKIFVHLESNCEMSREASMKIIRNQEYKEIFKKHPVFI